MWLQILAVEVSNVPLSPYMTAAATMATATDFLQYTGRRLVAMVITRCLAALVFSCSLSVGTELFGSLKVTLRCAALVRITSPPEESSSGGLQGAVSNEKWLLVVTCLFPGWASHRLLWESAVFKGGGVSCVHLEETDFYVLIFVVWREKRGRVGVKYEDWDTLLSVLEPAERLLLDNSFTSTDAKGLVWKVERIDWST